MATGECAVVALSVRVGATDTEAFVTAALEGLPIVPEPGADPTRTAAKLTASCVVGSEVIVVAVGGTPAPAGLRTHHVTGVGDALDATASLLDDVDTVVLLAVEGGDGVAIALARPDDHRPAFAHLTPPTTVPSRLVLAPQEEHGAWPAWPAASLSPAVRDLVMLAEAAVCLDRLVLPARPRRADDELPGATDDLGYWPTPDDGVRRCTVLRGSGAYPIEFVEAPAARPPARARIADSNTVLIPVAARGPAELADALDAVAAGSGDLRAAARAAYERWRTTGHDATVCAALVASSWTALRSDIAFFVRQLRSADPDREWRTPAGSVLTARPLRGDVAFVYPGFASAYPGAGRRLGYLFPRLQDSLLDTFGAASCRYLHLDVLNPRSDHAPDGDVGIRALSEATTALAAAYTALARDVFDLAPRHAFGYSIGEAAMLISLGVWRDVGQVSRHLDESGLLERRLVGEMTTVREYWAAKGAAIPPDDPAWAAMLVRAPVPEVIAASGREPGCFVPLINTPGEAVLAGLPDAVRRAAAQLPGRAVALEPPLPLHCAPMRAERATFYDEYLQPAHPPGLALYSSALYAPVPPESERLAAAVADSYTAQVDFPRLVRQVHAGGARVFVEIGPRRICSTWIDEILADREHVAVPLNLQGLGEDVALLRGLALLVAHRVPVDLDVLYEAAQGALTPATAGATTPRQATPTHAAPIADLITAEVAGVLACPVELVDPEARLLELGIDSIAIAGLADRAEQAHGIRLELADLIEAGTIAGLARLIEARVQHGGGAVRRALEPDREHRHDPFPISDLQRAYVFGRDASVPLGGIGCQAYFEFDLAHVDPDRFAGAWRKVVTEQDVLRLVITHGREQQVLPMPAECPLTVLDLRAAPDVVVERTRATWRAELTERVHDPAVWPLWDLRLALLPGGVGRLHAEFDLIAADAAALYGVLARLSATYSGAGSPAVPSLGFRDVKLAEDTDACASAAQWWAARIPELPLAPQLPLQADLAALTPPRFRRYRTEIDSPLTARLEEQAAARRLSLAAVLNAAFADTVATHSDTARFLLNLPVFLPPVRLADGELPLGNYTSNILVTADMAEGTFAVRTARLGQEVMTALAYRAHSGARVLAALAQQRGSGLEPQAPVVLTNLLEHRRASRVDHLPGVLGYGVSRTPQVLLDHQIVPTPTGVAFHWDHVQGAFAPDLVAAMAQAHVDLLVRLADGDAWDEPARAAVDLVAPPHLPVRAPTGIAGVVEVVVSDTEWAAVRGAAGTHRVDDATALLAACAETIARWSETARFTLAGVTGSRVHLCTVSAAEPATVLGRVAEWRAAGDARPYVVDEVAVVLRRPATADGLDVAAVPVAIAVGAHRNMAWASVTCTIEPVAGGLTISWHDRAGRCADGVLAALADLLVTVLRELADPAAWSRPLDVLPADQLSGRLAANATARVLEPALLHDGFVASARARPDALAVVAPHARRTYGELHERTDRLASALRARQVRTGDLVAVILEGNDRQVEAALAVSKAGAAYVPIDACWPPRRQRQVFERSGARCAIVAEPAADWLSGVPRIDIEAGDCAEAWPPPRPGDLGYVIFTSGSTGEPKGVAIEHAAAMNTIADMIDRFGVTADDRVFGLSSFAFDLSVFDIFGTPAAGAVLVLPERTGNPDPAHWHDMMTVEGVTLWNSVPALMEVLVAHLDSVADTDRPPLRQCWLSGDWIALTLPDRVRRAFPNADVISLGGATEASIWSIYHRVGPIDPAWRSIPYGRPLANQRWYVLDEAGRARPDLVPGDLHVAGAGLARGYWCDPERTANAFADRTQHGERTYRTGDRGRYHPDGTIEFLGRSDTRVKVRGHRIELGEIEAVLGTHPAVRQAVAAARTTPAGSNRLAAWVTVQASAHATAGELEDHVRDRLPAYMVPAVRLVSAVPLTANGKVDRAALPDPFRTDERSEPPAADSEVAAELSTLIGATLHCPPPALEDDLMDLGAGSLDVVTLVGEIERRYGMRPSYQDFFREPTVAALARMIGAAQPDPRVVAPAPVPPLIDPAEREAFKRADPGLRPIERGRLSIALPRHVQTGSHTRRRATRQFGAAPVPLDTLGAWLAHLASTRPEGERKHAFGSAGGLYSVQTYVHASGVDGLAPGVYYHHPREHSFVPITLGARIGPEIHDPFVNRPVFVAARFSVFLISCPAACEPMYGELASRFALLEAGAMAHVLELAAADHGLGICPIGWLDFAAIAALFHLEAGQQMLHSLVGGLLEAGDEPTHAWQEGEL